LGFAHDGQLKAAYNHFDSYPSWLGKRVLQWLATADLEEAVGKFDRLESVTEEVPATAEQISRYKEITGIEDVKTSDWYWLLRDAQGEPQEMLNSGFFVDASDFALDSLFCEWGYVVDLDAKQVEVYKGFQTSPPTEGRWAGKRRESEGNPIADKYHAVQLVRTVTLNELRNPDFASPKEVIEYIIEDLERSGEDDE
jgi:hypothetical protein